MCAQPWRRRLTVVGGAWLALVLVAAAAVVGVPLVAATAHRTDLERAVAVRAADTQRALVDRLGRRPARARRRPRRPLRRPTTLEQFLLRRLRRRPHLRLRDGATRRRCCSRRFGFSPADVDWELFSQCTAGAVLIVGLPDGVDFDELGDGFEALGYERPATRTRASGTAGRGACSPASSRREPDARSSSTSPSTPTTTCCSPATAARTCETAVRRPRTTTWTTPGLPTTWPRRSGEPLSAAVYTGDYACKALAMAQADEDDQSTADRAGRRGGHGRPDDRRSRWRSSPAARCGWRMAFENDDQARTNADSRADAGRRARRPARAATSPTGSPSVRSPPTASWSRSTCEPASRTATCSRDLSTGPVLFATC